MAFRGRGRGGRGRGGRSGGYEYRTNHAPYEDFPEEVRLPKMTCNKASDEEKVLLQSTLKFEEFWKTSCYHLEQDVPTKKNEDKEIDRFSDTKRKKHAKRESLATYLILLESNFPAELLQGSRQGQAINKKPRWDKDSGVLDVTKAEKAFEVFEKLEQTHKDGDKKEEKEADDEDEPEEEEAEEEENSDDDYNQNIEFDDDDDDWNQGEEAQEDYYD